MMVKMIKEIHTKFWWGKTWIETTLKPTRRREDNIKINVKLKGLAWTGFI